LQKAKYSVLIYDYRQFSQPGTKSDTENALIDGRAAFDYLIKERKISPAQLILMGRGIGASVCLQISKTAQCAGLILEDPWTDLKAHVDQSSAVAMKLIPRSMYPGDGLDNTVILKATHTPVLIAASNPKDSGGYDVFEQATAPKQFAKLRAFDSIHLPDLRLDPDKYTEKLATFLVAPEAPPEKSVESRISDLEKRLNDREEMKWQTDIETSIKKAKAEKKMVLVDVYATWCGPCKKMDAQTYSDPRVLNFIRENFVAVKVDADDDQGQEFSKKHKINLLPTLIILDTDGKIVDRMSGFASARELLRELKAL
jgi:thiol-disulfide isomerase/thioredoxin